MNAFIVVATKGRAKETYILLNYLAAQTMLIAYVMVVGSEPNDIAGLAEHPSTLAGNVSILLSRAGSCVQRNVGLDALLPMVQQLDPKDWFVVFFDDDFRPRSDWLEEAANGFISNQNLVGLSGWVLADGVNSQGIAENLASQYLRGAITPENQAWFGDLKEVDGLYGCNMAFRGNVASTLRFDENLPLYGWQEDVDYGASAAKLGKLFYTKKCVGVHLGVTSARTSGVKFGYSQIANPLYLVKKGTMTKRYAFRITYRNILANIFRTTTLNTKKDYRGRLYGNCLAILDLVKRKNHPMRVLEI